MKPAQVSGWLSDPGFRAVLDDCLSNKREAFRLLGTQMLPKALRKINDLLETADNPKAVTGALNLLLRTQALLIDGARKANPDSVTQLVAALRAPSSVTVLEGQFEEVE